MENFHYLRFFFFFFFFCSTGGVVVGGVSRHCTWLSATLLSLSNYTRYPQPCVRNVNFSRLWSFYSCSGYGIYAYMLYSHTTCPFVWLSLSIYLYLSLSLRRSGREGYAFLAFFAFLSFRMSFNRTIVQDSICYSSWVLLAFVSMIFANFQIARNFFGKYVLSIFFVLS